MTVCNMCVPDNSVTPVKYVVVELQRSGGVFHTSRVWGPYTEAEADEHLQRQRNIGGGKLPQEHIGFVHKIVEVVPIHAHAIWT